MYHCGRPLVEAIRPRRLIPIFAVLALAALLLSGCFDDIEQGPLPAATSTATAVANAGSDQTAFTSKLVTLNGSASAGATGYVWTQTAGTTVTLSSASSATPSFTSAPTAENLTFSLVVSNGATNSSADTVVVEVVETDDTFFSDQWHLSNTQQAGGSLGEDARVLLAWNNHSGFGRGVRIAIVDDGLEIAHEDLQANVVAGGSYHYADGGPDPTGFQHGTSVGGVAAGVGFNGKGVSGAAPRAQLVGYSLLSNFTTANEGDAMSRGAAANWISNNSWGPADRTGQLALANSSWEAGIQTGITSGRSGKGITYVWAAGNGHNNDVTVVDNSNHDAYANHPWVIAVCAVGDDGIKASYSEKGANLMVCAPSQGRAAHAITTVDRTGALGYNQTGSGGNLSDLNYTNTFNGTSSSAPLAAGVIALILEANPNLTWRDVRLILAENARKNDIGDGDWTTNGASLNINHKYGFGVVDADAMVARAETYTTYLTGNWTTFTTSLNSPNAAIPDDNTTGVSDTIAVSGSGITKIEFVQVEIAATHTYQGDLEFTLTAPGGTISILLEKHFCFSGSTQVVCSNALLAAGFKFGTVRHMNETAEGTWTLTVKDLAAADTGNLVNWRLIFYGR